jgi:hypothetical protein
MRPYNIKRMGSRPWLPEREVGSQPIKMPVSILGLLENGRIFGSEEKNSLIQYSRGLHNHMNSMGLLW